VAQLVNNPAKPNKIKPTLTPEITNKIPQGLVALEIDGKNILFV